VSTWGQTDSGLPTVSVVIAAYNYEQYVGEAIESVLSQGYPAELLEVVVVDDGSTDGTAEVVKGYEVSHPAVVRLVQQPNGGPEAAVNRGLLETRGDLVAFLDADDAWMPEKLLAQVAVLQDRPEVGLVFGDMLPVGPDGQPLPGEPLILHAMPPLTRRAAAQVLAGNVASTSAILVRRSVAEPIPAEIPIADWWFTLQAAFKGEIAWIRRPVVRYRMHNASRSSGRRGGGGAPKLGPFLRDVRFKLDAMRILDLSAFAPYELAQIWDGAEHSASLVLQNSGTHFAHLTSLVETDPERAEELAAEADRAGGRGEYAEEARLLTRALAWDPYLLGGRTRLREVVEKAEQSFSGLNPLAGARRFVILADAEELLAADDLLRTYAAVMAGSDLATLAIDASRLPEAQATDELTALVARCDLQARSDIDLLAIVGERDQIQKQRMHAGLTAYYRRPLRTPDAVSAAHEFTPVSLRQLRLLIERVAAQEAG
jgi:glycosyltransferase involved in cell wall biosynthesis